MVTLRSPLTEGRGLKRGYAQIPAHRQSSPLTEGRGLKHAAQIKPELVALVAPHGGAWIETAVLVISREKDSVAPNGGAWIETRQTRGHAARPWSPLTEGRGLKPVKRAVMRLVRGRPSRRGVD